MPETRSQTLLGFDFGLKRIGVAVGQTLTKSANPIAVLKAINGEPVWDDIKTLIQTWKADALVVGIPYNMDGSEQPLTKRAKNFIKKLRTHFSLPIYTIDERLSTVEAKQQLFDRGELKNTVTTQQLDSYAAKLILEQWLQK